MSEDGAGVSVDPRRLHVRIGRAAGGGYVVEAEVVDAAGGGSGRLARAALGPPPSLSDFLSSKPTRPDVEQVGHELFATLLADGVADVWTQARAAGVGGTILDIGPPELRALPWELIGNKITKWPFTSDTRAPAVRGRAPYRPAPEALPVPLRLLVVAGERNAADKEIEAIHRGLRDAPCCWHVEVLQAPGLHKLGEEYRRLAPHVLHFFGHGALEAGEPAFELRAAAGTERLTAGFVLDALPESPRLVVLNACRTAAQPATAAELARGLAETFLDGGSAAVVSMQDDIAHEPAERFAEVLYTRLAAMDPIDTAVATARHDLRWRQGMRPADWVLPVLEVRAHPAAVLAQAPRADANALITERKGFARVARLVDRSPVRWALHERIGSGRLLFVAGGARTGKSEVVRSCVITEVLRGRPVVYVSLEARNRVGDDDLIHDIAVAAQHWLADRDQMHRLCAAFLEGTPAPDSPAANVPAAGPAPGGHAAAGRVALPARPTLGGRPRSPAASSTDPYGRLRDLLTGLVETGPLALVLDHVGAIDTPDAFATGLLQPVVQGRLPGVHLVLVDGTDDLKRQFGAVFTDDRSVTVTQFRKAEATTLVQEYLARIWPRQADERDAARWEVFRVSMLDWARHLPGDADDPLPYDRVITAVRHWSYEADLDPDKLEGGR